MENETKTMAKRGLWINDEPSVKDFIKMAKEHYSGSVNFAKSGKQLYMAKLDPLKLKNGLSKNCAEAYFEINRSKCKKTNKCKDVFFLRIVDANRNENVIKIL